MGSAPEHETQVELAHEPGSASRAISGLCEFPAVGCWALAVPVTATRTAAIRHPLAWNEQSKHRVTEKDANTTIFGCEVRMQCS